MAKQGNRNNKKGNRGGYFDQNIQSFGPAFINRKTSVDIRKDSLRIFNDIMYSNINLERDAIYFANATFAGNLLLSAEDNYNYHINTATGLYYYIENIKVSNQYLDPIYYNILEIHQRASQAYKLIIECMRNIIYNDQRVTDQLSGLMVTLPRFKGSLNSTFIVYIRDNEKIERRRNYDQGRGN